MFKKIILILSFFLVITNINAQVCTNLDAGDDLQMLCSDDDVTLTATAIAPNYKTTRNYDVGGELLCPPVSYDGSRSFIQTDDEWSDFVIDIPFTFCFYENQYDQMLISGNGIVTFDLTMIDQFSNWNTDAVDLLGTNGQQNWQTNAIFGAYHDMNSNIQPREDRISYKTEGVAPNRQFVISFEAFQFSCTTLLSKSQITLYESSNVIDVRIDEKPVCANWNEGLAVVGIQNRSGTLSQTGREHGVWTPPAAGELWRFVPNGRDLDYTLTWYDANGTILNSDDGGLTTNNSETVIVDPQVETTYTVEMILEDQCNDTTASVLDTVTITPGFSPDLEIPVNLVECENPIGSGTANFNIDQTIFVLNGLDTLNFNISYHDSQIDADNNVDPITVLNPYNSSGETIYIRFEDVNDATCVTIRSFTLNVDAPDDSTFTYADVNYCVNDANPLPDAITTAGGTFTIDNGGVIIDNTTGEIDLANSDLGTDLTGNFTITYTTNNNCPTSSTFAILIENITDATFVYPSSVCFVNVINPLPTSITNLGGTFSVDGGATIDATSGALDLSSTTTQTTYTITYDFGGNCPSTFTQTIDVVADDDATFSYLNTEYCNDDVTNPLPDVIATLGGTFTINNGGVIIDNTTGEIDLASSDLGTDLTGNFTITYATTGACSTSFDFNVTINSISVDDPNDVVECDSYTLPALANGNYYTATNGGGTQLNAGDVITSTQPIFVYGETGTTTICTDENEFLVTINSTPILETTTDISACDTYTLPALTVGNYFTATNGGGTQLNAGDVITTNQTIFVYAETNTTPNCTAENSFLVTINTITVDVLNNVPDCTSYILPALTVGNYFTATNGGGTPLNAGDVITTDQTIHIYAETTTNPICSDNSSFDFTLYLTPIVNTPSTVLDSCNNGDGTANFDISLIEDEINTTDTVTYHPTQNDADNDTNAMLTVPFLVAAGNVWARAENANGCYAIVEIPLTVEQCLLIFPEVISPNSTGQYADNQTFSIDGIREMFPDFELYIYNRYGQEVYFGDASKENWNGKIDNDGSELPAGTYFYGINLNNDEKITHRGWVYLQR